MGQKRDLGPAGTPQNSGSLGSRKNPKRALVAGRPFCNRACLPFFAADILDPSGRGDLAAGFDFFAAKPSPGRLWIPFMEGRDARLRRRVIRKVVIVGDAEGPDYCSGFIVTSPEKGRTYVVTQSSFINGRDNHLKVCFFDKTELPASVVTVGETFCILSTDLHRESRAITPMVGAVVPSRAVTFAPSSPTDIYSIPSFVIVDSVDAYDVGDNDPTASDHISDSNKYFEFTCHYGEKCLNGHSRLVAAPIFSMTGDTMGIAAGDFRPNEVGGEIKLALSAEHIADMVDSLMAPLRESKSGGDEGSTGHKRSDASTRERGKDKCSSKDKQPAANKKPRGGDEGSAGRQRSDASKRKRGGDKCSSKDKKPAANKKQWDGSEGSSRHKRSDASNRKIKRGEDKCRTKDKRPTANKKQRIGGKGKNASR
ncbi:unnamed protein product [Urochloa humidicola]